MTFFEVETRKRDVAASRIQGLSYMRRARDTSRALVLAQFEKRFDIYSGTFYYHSNKSGVDTFVKPRVLRADQASPQTDMTPLLPAVKYPCQCLYVRHQRIPVGYSP